VSIHILQGLPPSAARVAQVASRYQPPRMAQTLVPRAGIAAQLADSLGKVTVLAGPPGCGKTTTLAAYYQSLAQQPTAALHWLSLSAEDNAPSKLRRHLLQAFALTQQPDEDELPDVPAGVVGFIDGLELLSQPQAHELVEWFALSLPASSRMFISTTRLRGALLHKAKLRGIVQLISAESLRLSDGEAAQLLGPGWSARQVQGLNKFVDGWAAGLRFLAQEPTTCQSILSQPHNAVLLPRPMRDYFEDEICTRLPQERLDSLMELAVLGRFTPELLCAVPGSCSSWVMVEEQIRNGLFVSYSDEQQHWACLHPAFACYLSQRLQRLNPPRYDELKLFAAHWLMAHGYNAEAVRHAVSMRRTEVAARLIEEAGAIAVDLGKGPELSLSEYLAPEQAAELPLLFIGQLYQRIRNGKFSEAWAAFEQAKRLSANFTVIHAEADPHLVQAWVHMIDLVFHAIYDLPITEAHLQRLQEELNHYLARDLVMAASIGSVLGFSYVVDSQFEHALSTCNRVLHAVGAGTADKVQVFLLWHKASALLAGEAIEQAQACVSEALRLALEDGSCDSYEVLGSQIMTAVLHYERGELAEAEALLMPALAQIRGINGWVRLYAEAYDCAAALLQQRQGWAQVEQVLRAGELFARERGLSRLHAHLALIRMRSLSRAGQWREAMALLEGSSLAKWLEQLDCSRHELPTQTDGLLSAAELLLALGRPRDALVYLARLNPGFMAQADCRLRFIQALLKMRANFALRRYKAAFAHLQVAVATAQRGGLLQRLREAGASLLEVCEWAQRNGSKLDAVQLEWLRSQVQHVSVPSSTPAPRVGSEASAQNFMLSPRETEIITLMAEGYINKEIAARLGISEGTVKGHRKKIHEKLAVSSRSQAINRARELLII
jgi:LuxR family maltose regulon positive regulatory protein